MTLAIAQMQTLSSRKWRVDRLMTTHQVTLVRLMEAPNGGSVSEEEMDHADGPLYQLALEGGKRSEDHTC